MSKLNEHLARIRDVIAGEFDETGIRRDVTSRAASIRAAREAGASAAEIKKAIDLGLARTRLLGAAQMPAPDIHMRRTAINTAREAGLTIAEMIKIIESRADVPEYLRYKHEAYRDSRQKAARVNNPTIDGPLKRYLKKSKNNQS